MWAKILDLFQSTWKAQHPGLDCLLWVDYANHHYQPAFLLKLARDGVYTAFLPNRTTEFTHPADWWLFARLQSRTIKILADEKVTLALLGGKWAGALWPACFQAELDTFTPSAIRESFEYSGLFPWSVETILDRCDHFLGQYEDSNHMVELSVQGATDVIAARKPVPNRKKRKAAVQTGVAYEVSQFAKAVEAEERAAAEKQNARRKRAKEKEERRRKKEHKRAANEERKQQREATRRERTEAERRRKLEIEQNREKRRMAKVVADRDKRKQLLMKTCNGLP